MTATYPWQILIKILWCHFHDCSHHPSWIGFRFYTACSVWTWGNKAEFLLKGKATTKASVGSKLENMYNWLLHESMSLGNIRSRSHYPWNMLLWAVNMMVWQNGCYAMSKLYVESQINSIWYWWNIKLLILHSICIKLPSLNLEKWCRCFYDINLLIDLKTVFADRLCLFQVEKQGSLIGESLCIFVQIYSLLLYECAI